MAIFIKAVQYTGFVLSQITNWLLLYLVINKTSKKFGSYKYLMLGYVIYALIYTVIEITAHPLIYGRGYSFFMYPSEFMKYEKWFGVPLISSYAGSFYLCVSLLCSHFFYRYVALCRPMEMYKIENKNLCRLFIPPIVIGVVLTFFIDILLGPKDVKSEYVREDLEKIYGEDSYKLSYICALYFYTDPETNSPAIGWTDFAIILICVVCMELMIAFVILCGYQTYHQMQSNTSMSQKTRDLNKQLFRTLIIQTIVPMVMMFLPVGSLLVLPMFGIELGTIANAPCLYAGLYPAIDALVAIFMIKEFRNFVLCKKGVMSKAKVNTSTQDSFQ